MDTFRKPTILIPEPEYCTAHSITVMSRVGRVIQKRMTRAELLRSIPHVDALICRIETKVDRLLIERARQLQCVISATTGTNHIDTAALQSRNIPLFSLHGTHSVSTAEHVLALLFAVARRIPDAHAHLTKGRWQRFKYIGTELHGKTLGIFGIGRIGTEVARRARALGMKVIAFDPYVAKQEIARRGAQKTSWLSFVTNSEIVSLNAPLTKKTNGVFDRTTFQKLKPGAIIINTARGEIIDEEALLASLRSGHIKAAALDVYPEEPLPQNHVLRRYARTHGNLILTPHLGASTEEAIAHASTFCAQTILTFFGKPY